MKPSIFRDKIIVIDASWLRNHFHKNFMDEMMSLYEDNDNCYDYNSVESLYDYFCSFVIRDSIIDHCVLNLGIMPPIIQAPPIAIDATENTLISHVCAYVREHKLNFIDDISHIPFSPDCRVKFMVATNMLMLVVSRLSKPTNPFTKDKDVKN